MGRLRYGAFMAYVPFRPAMRACRATSLAACAVITCLGLLVPTSPALAGTRDRPSPGAPGAGDPYFPAQGNGGYDVASYRLAIDYRPATHRLDGRATVAARATQALSRFDLDLRPWMRVRAVSVDGRRASFDQPAGSQELVITPSRPLWRGHRFEVAIRYGGTAQPVTDPDGALDGWVPTSDGAFVASEPQGSPSWYPCNDTPTDKATFAVSITVPDGVTAVSNGRFRGVHRAAGLSTWRWRLDRPIPTYLVTATLGRFEVSRGRTPAGVPYLNAVDPTQAEEAAPVLAQLPAMVDFFTDTYGPYPFDSAGAIVDSAPEVGYALETATRPVFDSPPDEATLSHELAHQWYGDDVTLQRWRDIWLNEGFAEFSSWLWAERPGGPSAAVRLKELLAEPADSGDFDPPPANPGGADMIFSGSVYERGAGALQGLREEVGDRTFFRIMRGWLRVHAYGNATVPQFVHFAEKVSHRDLTHFFDVWLYQEGKPTSW
jgi:aminopeptidase N